LTTILYLAHLNPLTNAHIEIINQLKEKANIVKVMPVIFRLGEKEVTSKSFPFNFEVRKKMIESVFGDSVLITEDYTFDAPFKKYLPPLLSLKSWKLRKKILTGVKGDYYSYTGDKAEGYMLKLYRLKPKIGERRSLSAASVKEKMYGTVVGKKSDWRADVPKGVGKIIDDNWHVIEKYSKLEDKTRRVLGMKFPLEGWSE
jgi:predicted nuclease of restriction endonuclease-like RecB superfamily